MKSNISQTIRDLSVTCIQGGTVQKRTEYDMKTTNGDYWHKHNNIVKLISLLTGLEQLPFFASLAKASKNPWRQVAVYVIKDLQIFLWTCQQ